MTHLGKYGSYKDVSVNQNMFWCFLSILYLSPSPDVNDNVPFFTSSIYEASVTEGAKSGTLVFQVSANDLDLGPNGKVRLVYLNDFFIKLDTVKS